MAKNYTSLSSWSSWVSGVGDIPASFLMSWIRVESYGNPCAVGMPGIEAGIAQTYHPDDDRHGATFAQLRANCDGKLETRPLTEDERRLQVKVLVALVRNCRDRAHAVLEQVGGSWSPETPDYWALTKLWHGLPGMVKVLLPEFKAKRGRAPAGWREFRAFVESLTAADVAALHARGHTWVTRFRSQFTRILNNAEKTANGLGAAWTPGGAELSTLAHLLFVPGLAVLYKLLGRWPGIS